MRPQSCSAYPTLTTVVDVLPLLKTKVEHPGLHWYIKDVHTCPEYLQYLVDEMTTRLDTNTQWRTFVMKSVTSVQVVCRHSRADLASRFLFDYDVSNYVILTLKAGSVEPWMSVVWGSSSHFTIGDIKEANLHGLEWGAKGLDWVQANGFPDFADHYKWDIVVLPTYQSDQVNESSLSWWWGEGFLAHLRQTKMIK
ncbi:hypothetical protein K491DRAFT_722133 [Lophiostoma macrostomum CBS 122681]|uniref:Uncharacterized protein n=1 Tax=Lophiostoma macrostomum CBS 122681 TaxID=1314788 RepID=A0A6A6SRX7_9PLEO|nr:hypothetical protein K491DRAFT_722133 [Lophiostoma macrostomum CBS 122681]